MSDRPTMTRTRPDGALVEYRQQYGVSYLWIEARVLKPDGAPYDDNWFPLSDEGWVILKYQAPEVIRGVVPDLAHSDTLTPRG